MVIPEPGVGARDAAGPRLDGARVPASARLGDEGAGFKVAMSALDYGRISLAAGSVGIAQGCLDASTRYAAERRQFGKPLAQLQLVQELLAEMAVETEAARLLAWRAAALADAGQPFTPAASLQPGVLYTATLTTAVRSTTSSTLAAAASWSSASPGPPAASSPANPERRRAHPSSGAAAPPRLRISCAGRPAA